MQKIIQEKKNRPWMGKREGAGVTEGPILVSPSPPPQLPGTSLSHGMGPMASFLVLPVARSRVQQAHMTYKMTLTPQDQR